MTIKQIYDLAIKLGIEHDLRGKDIVARQLKRAKEKFEKLSKKDQALFDLDRLTNPYPDSRILVGVPNTEVKRLMAGIDIDAGELLIAKHLSAEKAPVDLVISHHPLGKALATLSEVMPMMAEILALYGVPINIAESLLELRICEVSRGISAVNHFKTVDAAKNLKLNLMCLHTAMDNLVASYLNQELKKQRLEYVSELMDFLHEIPEYKEATLRGAGPKIFAGNSERQVGKIAVTEVTGGTEGSVKMYERMAQAGVGTVIGMHMSEEHKKEAEAAHINAIIAGHISSDSLGMNLFLDELEKRGIEITPCGGLIRVSRAKKSTAKAR
jgi:putative NIF3 family GTP cyclohydrolase 1 type 2